MYIIRTDKINSIRMGVMKLVFEFLYKTRFLFTDTKDFFSDDNYLEGIEISTGEKCYIFLETFKFRYIKKKYRGEKIFVFVLTNNFSRAKKGNNSVWVNKEVFSNEYIGFLNNQFINNFKNIKLEGNFIEEYKINNDVEIMYKYYKENPDNDRKVFILSGNISFCNPTKFNDPFDCDYNNFVTGKRKDSFKALCLAPRFDNILMWSYYSSDHKGYCLGYDVNEILNELSKVYNGLCIIGKIRYKTKRPKFNIKKTLSLFDETIGIIDATFTKYEPWSHEEEYRLLILDDNPKVDYLPIKVTVKEAYLGIWSTMALPFSFTKKLAKDSKDYLLR